MVSKLWVNGIRTLCTSSRGPSQRVASLDWMVLHLFEPAENPTVSWMCLNDCERRRVNIPNIMSFIQELLPKWVE